MKAQHPSKGKGGTGKGLRHRKARTQSSQGRRRRPRKLGGATDARQGRVYHAHAMQLYGRQKERNERAAIQRAFEDHLVINPGAVQENPQKAAEGMAYCLRLVDSCQILVYSRFQGKITAGVGAEVNHALQRSKPVFEIRSGKLRRQNRPVRHLTPLESWKLGRKKKPAARGHRSRGLEDFF